MNKRININGEEFVILTSINLDKTVFLICIDAFDKKIKYFVQQNVEGKVKLISSNNIEQISIVSSAIGSLGYVKRKSINTNILNEENLRNNICCTLGGLAAEKVIFGDYTSGVENDLEQAINIAKEMLKVFKIYKNIK